MCHHSLVLFEFDSQSDHTILSHFLCFLFQMLISKLEKNKTTMSAEEKAKVMEVCQAVICLCKHSMTVK